MTERSIRFVSATAKRFLYDFLLVRSRLIFNNLLGINSNLADNTRTKTVKNELDKKYDEAKGQIMEHIVQPQMMKAFAGALGSNPLNPNGNIEMSEPAPYKRSLPFEVRGFDPRALANAFHGLVERCVP